MIRPYVHQFLERGVPRALCRHNCEKLAALLGCGAEELRHPPAPTSGAPLAAVPEMEVVAAAGPGTLNDEFALEKARWHLPEGDRLTVDVSRRIPVTGEIFVLWDGNGLVVKRVETMRGEGPPRLRLLSANPDYEPDTCLVQEAHIVGKVIWTVRRA